MIETLEPITKDDWVEWKRNAITKRFLLFVGTLREDKKEELVRMAGLDPHMDNFYRGYCQALESVLQVDLEEVAND